MSKAMIGLGLFMLASTCWSAQTDCTTLDQCELKILYGDSNAKMNALAASAQFESKAIPLITKALKDKDADVRDSAISALGRIGKKSTAAVPPLIAMLGDARHWRQSASALKRIGINAVPDLIKQLFPKGDSDGKWSAEDRNLMRRSRDVLASMGKVAVPALTEVLHECAWRHIVAREDAAEALGQIGPQAQEAIPDLIQFVRGSRCYEEAKSESYAAQFKEVHDMVVTQTREGEALAAARALGNMGAVSRDAVPAIVELLSDAEFSNTADRKRTLAEAMGKIGAASKSGVPMLIQLLRDEDETVRNSAITALGQIGPDSSAAIPTLKAIAESGQGETRKLAANAVRRISK